MKPTRLSIYLSFVLVFATFTCKGGNGDGELIKQIPEELHGLWCNNNSSKCDMGFSINAREVWDSSAGGCMQIDTVRQDGIRIHVSCKNGAGLMLSPVDANRLELKLEGDQQVYMLRRQTGGTGASLDPDG